MEIIGPNWRIIQPSKTELKDYFEKSYYHTEHAKRCVLCGVLFKHGRSDASLCNCHKIFIKCHQCGKEFQKSIESLSGAATLNLIQCIKNNTKIIAFCSKECQYLFLNTTDKMKEQARQNCSKINNFTYTFCNICKRETKHDSYGNCLTCKSFSYDRSNIGYHISFCYKCNKETMHNSQFCCECYPNKNGQYGANGKVSSGMPKEMHIFDNFGNTCVLNCPKRLKCINKNSSKIPKNKYGYCQEAIKLIFQSVIGFQSFEIKNNILLFYNKQLKDYVPWEEYKKEFLIKNVDWKLPENFKFIPTFRTQDSNDWTGSKTAFEQFLVDEGIGWFVYIKFYVSAEKRILPLVIGKSGSLLVNASGSDLSFSTDVKDGPARRFLLEEGLEWCKTQIAILPCISEQNALNKEKENKEKFNLFYS